jgi:hypothetical protein
MYDAIFADLRDRRFLKWMLSEDADSMGPILHERDGTPLMPISEAVQAEMRAEWIDAHDFTHLGYAKLVMPDERSLDIDYPEQFE